MILWEILVPKYLPSGVEIDMDHHHQWDDFVLPLSQGLTIMRSAKGFWSSPRFGDLVVERMIPVRLICSRKEIEQIVDFTKQHYEQEAVMAYKISDEVIIR